MTDLKLFNKDSVVEFGTDKVKLNLLKSDTISAPAVSRLEVLTNKVVKFLLTEYGSNAFDPTYGSNWVTMTQVAQPYIPKFIITVNSDIDRCISYIKAGEQDLSNSLDKLQTVKFNGLEYSTLEPTFTTQILISITIYTTLGNKAVFSLSNS